jgi:hypothetical protein
MASTWVLARVARRRPAASRPATLAWMPGGRQARGRPEDTYALSLMIGRRYWFTVRVVEENVTGIITMLVAGAGVDAGALALLGQPGEARAAGEASIAIADSFGLTVQKFFGYECLCMAAMACGDGGALREASQEPGSTRTSGPRRASRTTPTWPTPILLKTISAPDGRAAATAAIPGAEPPQRDVPRRVPHHGPAAGPLSRAALRLRRPH